MHNGRFVFSQIMEVMHHWDFQRIARKHGLNGGKFGFSAWDHFCAMAFAQLTYRESLRDIETCLGAQESLQYHLGFSRSVKRTTLAYANEHRDWRFFAELGERLIRRARKLYEDEPSALDLDGAIYALDSTMIDLSLALCPWADWTGQDAAMKMHTLLDLRGELPAFVTISEGDRSDQSGLDDIPLEAGSYYVMYRGYLDLRRLKRLCHSGAYFVIREHAGVCWRVLESHKVDRSGALRCDQTIRFTGRYSHSYWPEPMRRVGIFDHVHRKRMAFWTNQWSLPAFTISELYRQRWRIEIFFRWIKQNLRIRSFYGTTSNAVRVQIWSAICTYLLVAILRKQLRINRSITEILQIVSVNVFQQVPITSLLADLNRTPHQSTSSNQLNLNGF
jgi:hypothetical protein